MLKWVLLLGLLAQSVPAATAASIVLPNGGKGFSVRCNDQGINACYELAGEICQHGYVIQNQNIQPGFVSQQSASLNANPEILNGESVGYSKSISDNGLIIACNDPDEMERIWADRVRLEKEKDAVLEAKQAQENTTTIAAVFAGLGLLAVVSLLVLLNN